MVLNASFFNSLVALLYSVSSSISSSSFLALLILLSNLLSFALFFSLSIDDFDESFNSLLEISLPVGVVELDNGFELIELDGFRFLGVLAPVLFKYDASPVVVPLGIVLVPFIPLAALDAPFATFPTFALEVAPKEALDAAAPEAATAPLAADAPPAVKLSKKAQAKAQAEAEAKAQAEAEAKAAAEAAVPAALAPATTNGAAFNRTLLSLSKIIVNIAKRANKICFLFLETNFAITFISSFILLNYNPPPSPNDSNSSGVTVTFILTLLFPQTNNASP